MGSPSVVAALPSKLGTYVWRHLWLLLDVVLLLLIVIFWPGGEATAVSAGPFQVPGEARDRKPEEAEPFTLFPKKEVEPELQPVVEEYRQKMKEKNELLLRMEKDNVELRVELDRMKKAQDEIKHLTKKLAETQKDLEEKGYVIPEKLHVENLVSAARTLKTLAELEAAAEALESGLNRLHQSHGRFLAARHLEAFATLRRLKVDRRELVERKAEAERIKIEMEGAEKRVERGMTVFTYPPEKPLPLVKTEAWAKERLSQVRSGIEVFLALQKKVEGATELPEGPTADRLIAEGKFLRAEDLSPDSQRRKREDEKRDELKKLMEELAAEIKDKGKGTSYRFAYCRGWSLHRLFINSHFTVEGQYLPSYDTWRAAVLTAGRKVEPTVSNYETFLRHMEPLRQLGWFQP